MRRRARRLRRRHDTHANFFGLDPRAHGRDPARRGALLLVFDHRRRERNRDLREHQRPELEHGRGATLDRGRPPADIHASDVALHRVPVDLDRAVGLRRLAVAQARPDVGKVADLDAHEQILEARAVPQFLALLERRDEVTVVIHVVDGRDDLRDGPMDDRRGVPRANGRTVGLDHVRHDRLRAKRCDRGAESRGPTVRHCSWALRSRSRPGRPRTVRRRATPKGAIRLR